MRLLLTFLSGLAWCQPIAVHPVAAAVNPGQTVKFTADASVTWNVIGPGAICPDGTYIAPSQVAAQRTSYVVAAAFGRPSALIQVLLAAGNASGVQTCPPTVATAAVQGPPGPQGAPGRDGAAGKDGVGVQPSVILQQSSAFALQGDGSWFLPSALLPVNPWGGVPFTSTTFVVVRNGLIVYADSAGFQTLIEGTGKGPYNVRIVPACPPCTLPWTATDDVRVLWAASLL